MTRKRRTFDKEFKQEAVKMVLEQGLSRAEVGRKLGVDYNSICNWVKSSQETQASASGNATTLSENQKRIKELEKQLKLKEMEVEFLKKRRITLRKSKNKISSHFRLDWKVPLNEIYANLRMQVCCSFPTSSVLVRSLESFHRSRAVISLGVNSGLAGPISIKFLRWAPFHPLQLLFLLSYALIHMIKGSKSRLIHLLF